MHFKQDLTHFACVPRGRRAGKKSFRCILIECTLIHSSDSSSVPPSTSQICGSALPLLSAHQWGTTLKKAPYELFHKIYFTSGAVTKSRMLFHAQTQAVFAVCCSSLSVWVKGNQLGVKRPCLTYHPANLLLYHLQCNMPTHGEHCTWIVN